MKVNVVLSSGQESDMLRLYAYMMPCNQRNQKFFMKNKNKIKDVYKTLIRQLENHSVSALTELFGNLGWENMMDEAYGTMSLLKQLWPEGSDIRRVLCVTTCSWSLKCTIAF